jgi:hypothetical protein
MEYKKLKLSVLLLYLSMATLNAQEAFTVTGGEATGTDGSVSYSVGLVSYTTNTAATGSVAQGVQQPYEISVVTGIEEADEIKLSYTVYPNPTTDFLTLQVNNYDNTNLWYKLLDLNGKLLEHKKIKGDKTNINMSNFVSAAYFLSVTDNKREIKNFKIIKN